MNKRIISLLSDGFDSPVASYLMIKMGFTPIFVSFITTSKLDMEMMRKIKKIVKKLSDYTNDQLKLFIIPHTSNLEIFKTKCPRKLTCILCKRLMFRIAFKVAKMEGTNLILTGDILGEQASQTLSNLYSYNEIFTNFIKLSPLIGLNKQQIINLNKKIGLYDISSYKIQSCQYFPQYPETNAKEKEIENTEKLLNLSQLISNSLENVKILKF
ncbi:MAG: hypothetical protein ACQERB_09665 [Promethearchaeati archaeon]